MGLLNHAPASHHMGKARFLGPRGGCSFPRRFSIKMMVGLK